MRNVNRSSAETVAAVGGACIPLAEGDDSAMKQNEDEDEEAQHRK
jgi:hypothetical protein